jgi:hypothetical protein
MYFVISRIFIWSKDGHWGKYEAWEMHSSLDQFIDNAMDWPEVEDHIYGGSLGMAYQQDT